MPLPLIVAGSAFSVAGTLFGNSARAEQEAQNAWFYRKQAAFAQQAMFRETELARIQYTQLKGQQTSAFARGGVDVGSGSAAGVLASTAGRELDTILAIRTKGELEITLANARADAAQSQANTYGSFGYNLLTGFAAGAQGAMAGYNLGNMATSVGSTGATGAAKMTPSAYASGGFMQGPGWELQRGNDFFSGNPTNVGVLGSYKF